MSFISIIYLIFSHSLQISNTYNISYCNYIILNIPHRNMTIKI